MTFTILNTAGKFWNGYKFVTEYPEAKLFAREREARAVASVISRREAAKVFVDYGFETQTLLISVGTRVLDLDQKS